MFPKHSPLTHFPNKDEEQIEDEVWASDKDEQRNLFNYIIFEFN